MDPTTFHMLVRPSTKANASKGKSSIFSKLFTRSSRAGRAERKPIVARLVSALKPSKLSRPAANVSSDVLEEKMEVAEKQQVKEVAVVGFESVATGVLASLSVLVKLNVAAELALEATAESAEPILTGTVQPTRARVDLASSAPMTRGVGQLNTSPSIMHAVRAVGATDERHLTTPAAHGVNTPPSTILAVRAASGVKERLSIGKVEWKHGTGHRGKIAALEKKSGDNTEGNYENPFAFASSPIAVARWNWQVTGRDGFDALTNDNLTDKEFKQRLSKIRPGLVLPAEPELSKNVRRYTSMLVEDETQTRSTAWRLREKINRRVELEELMERYAECKDMSDSEFRARLINVKPGFDWPEKLRIRELVRAYALKLVEEWPDMEGRKMRARMLREQLEEDRLRCDWYNRRRA